MKTLRQFTTAVLALWSITILAQQGINYKALIKDNGGNIVANQNITIQFQILEGAGMVNVYQETHSPMTDANGIVIVNIGEGTTSDNFSALNWGADDHFLNVQIDTGGGLTDMGTTQFMAVPYALYAENFPGSTGPLSLNDLVDGKSDSDGSEDGSSVFLGVNAGLNDDGTDNANIGVGFESLYSNTTGAFNAATGYLSLYTNTTGSRNTANGYKALQLNGTGSFNTAVGFGALLNNDSGERNTAVGYESLLSNTIGTRNTASGYFALFSNTEGNYNTASGYGSLYTNLIGKENTANGYMAPFFQHRRLEYGHRLSGTIFEHNWNT